MSFEVKNISYQYAKDSPKVLNNVCFNIQENAVTAIVGPSGSGKTTMVDILSRVIPDLIGNGVLEGEFRSPEGTLVSVVSQSPENQLFGYGVEDAISFGIENMGIPHEELVERVEYVLDLLNLQHLRGRSVSKLSGGQRQAVCIASVLAMDPDVLIMDEPVSSLDPNGKKMVQRVLAQLRASGHTTVIVDNNLEWSVDVVDHVIGLKDGVVVFDGTKEEFFMDFELQEQLGVTIPQEVELFRELSRKFGSMDMFYSVEGAERSIAKLLPHAVPSTTYPEIHETDAPAVITTHALNKTFEDDFHALIDVNTAIPEGRIIAILGQNGSGKTTFVKHLNGLYKPTSGDVRYRGESHAGKTVAKISNHIILVFQHPEHMLFEESVFEEITFCAKMQGVSFTEEEVMEVLRQYNLDQDKDTFPINLSMGKKHILTILSVLFSRADVVILDEPTLGMDLLLKKRLEEIMLYLKSQGKTVITISHEIPLVFKLCDYGIILDGGKKIFEGDKEQLARADAMFSDINITLPPVVQLSKRFGLSKICYDVPSFVAEVEKARG